MKIVVKRSGFYTYVTLGEDRAVVHYKETTLRVQTMRGVVQRHRGYVGTFFVDGRTTRCGHQLHQKVSAARECAVAQAKRALRERAKESSPED